MRNARMSSVARTMAERITMRGGILLLLALLIAALPRLLSAQTRYSLQDLLRCSLAGNPDIEQLASATRADNAALDEARADPLPSVKLMNYSSFIGNPQAPISIAKGSVGSLPVPGVGSIPLPESDTVVVPGGENWGFDAEVQVTQPLFNWGKIRSNIALHRDMITADDLKTMKKRDDVQTLVHVDYYALYYLGKLAELLSEQKAVADRMLQIAQDSFGVGQISEMDLTAKKMKIGEIDHAIVSVEEQRESILRDLRFETDRHDLSADEVSFDAIDGQLTQRTLPDEQTLLRRALGYNNDIKLSAAAEATYRSKVEIERSGALFKPDLALSLRLGYTGPVLNDWKVQDDWVANVTLVVSSPLYDGGKSGAMVAEARAQLEQAVSQTRSAVRSVSKYISESYYELGVAKKNIAYYEERSSNAQAIEAYQKHLLDVGAGSKVDYYQRRVDVFTELAHVIEQQIAFATRYFTLQNVTGGAE
jgi:outer membrane protein TolC